MALVGHGGPFRAQKGRVHLVLRISAVRRVITAIAIFLIALSALLLPAAAQNSTFSSAVWLADHKHLKRIDLVTNQVDLTVSLDHEAEALAVDPTDSGVWALAQKKLFKFDSNGQAVFQVDIKSLVDKLDDPKHLVLNPYDASLWVGGEKMLVHVNAQGQWLGAWQVSGEIQAMELDADESLWLLTHKSLLHLSRQGAILHNLNLKSRVKEPEYLAVDSLGGLVWVAGKKELIQLELSHLDQSVRTVSLPPKMGADETKISALAVDPLLGNLWITTEKNHLLIYDRSARPLKTVDFGSHDLGETLTLVFEPLSASFWVGGKKAVGRFDSNGEFVARIAVDKEAEALGVVPFSLLPTLKLLEPENGDLTNNPRPTIRLGLGASCNAIPCFLPEVYTNTLALSVDLNGLPVGSLFSRTGAEAVYTPADRLPEGLNNLNAQAVDLFGHASNLLAGYFTIDTIPPKFLAVNPSDNSVVTMAAVSISGQLDDATANVMLLDHSNTVLNMGGASFNFSVLLKTGLNTFTLIARDPAGNQTSLPLRLTYNAVKVTITNPTTGTGLSHSGVLVTGTFQGPPNTGITLNGVIALVYGNQFFANLNLDPGPNTLTAVATTPEGITASDTITVTVNRTSPDPVQISAEPQSGIAPLVVRFKVDNFSGQPSQQISADFNGDGSNDFSTSDPNAPVEFTYTTPGVYRATITVTDSQNTVYSQILAVVVRDGQQLDQLFTSLWGGMNDALIRGDVNGAAQYLNEGAKRKYQPIFEALKPQFPQIIASYSQLRRISITDSIGEYAIVRPYNGQNRVYLIYFLQDADGVWRMDAM